MPDVVGGHLYPPDPLPPIIPGGSVNLLAGAPGTGKSTLLAWLSRQVEDKAPLWGYQWGAIPFQGIICADRSWERSTHKWYGLEGMEAMPAYSLQDDPHFVKARMRKRGERINVLEYCLAQLSPTKDGAFPLGSLLYIDPLAPFLGGNLLDYDVCMVACMEIRELCLKRGVTVIGTAHASKQKADRKDQYLRLQDRILGSTALFGYTDTQMYLAAPDEIGKAHYAFLWAPHHAPTQTFRFDRALEDGRFLPGEELDAEGTAKPHPSAIDQLPKRDMPDWLAARLAEGPATFAALIEIAKGHNMSRATLHRTIQALKTLGHLSSPKHGEYALPTTH